MDYKNSAGIFKGREIALFIQLKCAPNKQKWKLKIKHLYDYLVAGIYGTFAF